MSNSNHVVFKKIPLSVLISALHDAWNNGAEFIDLSGNPDEEQDVIGIVVRKEYLAGNSNSQEDINFTIEKEVFDDEPESEDDFGPII